MDLVNLLSGSRRSDRVYQGKCVCDLVEGLLQKPGSRRSVKIYQDFCTVGFQHGFQVQLSKCWLLVCESRLSNNDLISLVVFFPCLNLLIFSLTLLEMGFYHSLSPGFSACGPRQYDTVI